jgi:hypothetical protein
MSVRTVNDNRLNIFVYNINKQDDDDIQLKCQTFIRTALDKFILYRNNIAKRYNDMMRHPNSANSAPVCVVFNNQIDILPRQYAEMYLINKKCNFLSLTIDECQTYLQKYDPHMEWDSKNNDTKKVRLFIVIS